ncbi:MAG TPA: 3-hydroxyacyl-CoA dehydrogenase NAD-binding domain-containing protein, partial [Erysipelotrichaceae bacterium]|nr:3-hydroxyacyl-CoA dehydrogenase NAD-binding domain-containing protein [Erysipelotrichaceae bacterium]
MRTIKTVTVVGANGTMGCNVSAIFASFGNAKVYMVSRNIEDAKAAVEKAAKSVRATAITANLIPADYSLLSKCVAESDLIFESVAENFETKAEVTRKIAENIREKTVICSGTSGLSITSLAQQLPEELRGCYLGVHMFNPPYYM